MKDMSDNRRRHLRGAARKVDESHRFSNFREEYARANDADAAQKRAATDRKKKNASKRLEKLQEFEPVLNLDGKTFEGARVEHMKTQLKWHRTICGDNEVPHYFHRFNKGKLWDAVGKAVKRYWENKGHKGK